MAGRRETWACRDDGETYLEGLGAPDALRSGVDKFNRAHAGEEDRAVWWRGMRSRREREER